MSGLSVHWHVRSNRSKEFALVRSASQFKILPEEADSIGRDSLFIWSCACRGADIDTSARYFPQYRLASPQAASVVRNMLKAPWSFQKNVMISTLIPNLAKFF